VLTIFPKSKQKRQNDFSAMEFHQPNPTAAVFPKSKQKRQNDFSAMEFHQPNPTAAVGYTLYSMGL